MERLAKVRRFKSHSKNQLKIRASSSGVPAISENHGSSEQFHMSKAKRVKYAYSESDRARHTNLDVPKTSEYAFFKKLKEDMCSSVHTLRKDRDQLKTANANDPNTGNSIPFKAFESTHGKMRTPLQEEKERPNSQFSFPSPSMRVFSRYAGGLNSKDEFREFGSGAPHPCTYATPDGKNLVLSPFPSASKISGDEYVGKGTFSGRRHKLRQLVANSCPEAGEGCSKGFDLVPVLLSRLLPGRYENECCHTASSEEKEMDTTYPFAAPQESYSEEIVSSIPNSGKLNFGSCYSDDSPEYWFGSSRMRVIPKWDVTDSNTLLTKYDAANDFQIGKMNSFCSLDDEPIEKNFLERDSFCYPSFENHQSTCSGHLKQKNKFIDPDEYSHTHLLGWDTNEEQEQHNGFSWSTSSNAAFQQTLDDSLTALTWQTPSSQSNSPLNLHPLPYFLSAGGRSHDVGIDKEDNYTAVPASPRYLTMAEDCDNCPEKKQVILYCQDDPYCIGIDTARKDHKEALPWPGGFTNDLGWKLLPFNEVLREDYSSRSNILQLPFKSKEDVNSLAFVQDEESSFYGPEDRETTRAFPEDALNFRNWLSSNFHVLLDKFLGQPLLLNYLDQDRSEDTTYIDAENQWNSY